MLRNIADAHILSLGYLWCRPKGRVGFLRRFGLKTGVDFAHSGLEPGTVLEWTRRSLFTYSLFL